MRTAKRITGMAVLLLLAGAAISCRENNAPSGVPARAVAPATNQANTNLQVFFVRGVVEELLADGKTAVIKHEAIPNYMEAMSMPLEVKEPKELAGLQPGDAIFFRMLVTKDDAWIDRVTRTGKAAPAAEKPPTPFRRVREVEPLRVGDLMPNYPFTNELGQAVSLQDFKGQALGFTFIFTRCPFPTFCPRMMENLAKAYQQLSAQPGGAKNWHLLSISFDPEFDTPTTLKAYAQRHQYDPLKWNFVTGALIEIDAITEQFGLEFFREAGSSFNFNHKLRTVVVDAQGRVQQVFVGNEWKVDDFVAEMVKAAAAK